MNDDKLISAPAITALWWLGQQLTTMNPHFNRLLTSLTIDMLLGWLDSSDLGIINDALTYGEINYGEYQTLLRLFENQISIN